MYSAGCKAKVLVSRASTKDLSEIPLFIAKHISVQTSPQAGLGSDLLRTYLRFKDTWWWSGGEKKVFKERERREQLKRLQYSSSKTRSAPFWVEKTNFFFTQCVSMTKNQRTTLFCWTTKVCEAKRSTSLLFWWWLVMVVPLLVLDISITQ